MTTTRLPTSLITTGSQNGQRLKDIFLVSVTASALLLGLLGVAYAQSADDPMTQIKAIEALAPAGSISSDTQKEIDKANQAGTDYFKAKQDLKTAQDDAVTKLGLAVKAQSDVDSAQKAVNDAQAKLDAANKVYSGATTAAAALNKAVTEYNTQKGWLDTATKSLAIANQGQAAFDAALKSTDPDVKKAVAGYKSSDFAKFKVDAAAGFANAQTKTWAAQYVAQVASDAVKDPKNGLAPLQDANKALQAAKTTLATNQQASTAATAAVNNANTVAQTAQNKVDTTGAAATSQATKAFNDANSDMVSFQNKPAAPAKPSAPGNVAVVTPSSGTPIIAPAPIVVTPTAPGAGLISEHGAGVISNDGGSIISHDAGTIISHDAGSLVSKSSSGVLTDNGMLATGSPGNKIISDNSEGLLSERGAGVASNSAAGFTMKGAGVSAYSGSSTTPDRELNDQTTIRDTKNQLTDAQLKLNAAQTAVNGATSDVTAAQAAVKAAQDKVDALNKSFSGAKSAGDALTAAVKDYNNEKSWLDKASASLALANKGQAAFDAARNSKDPTVAAAAAGYTDYAKFKADATAGYANALDKTNKAQYVAQVAADVVKDPKNGLAPLQKANGDLQAAQAALATKQQAASDANTRLVTANATVTNLNTTITKTQADLDAYHQQQQATAPGQQGNINITGVKGTIDPPPTPSATPGRSETRDYSVPTDGTGRSTSSPTRTVLSVDTPESKSSATLANAANPTNSGAPAAEVAKLQQAVVSTTDSLQKLQSEMDVATKKGDTKTVAALQGQLNSAKAQVDNARSALTKAQGAPPPNNQIKLQDASGPKVANAAPTATTAPAPTSAASVESAPAKLTADQGKAVHQALSTIPGNLNKSEQKQFDTLSTLVDKATSKGLTPDEATQLKAGLSALADKHPKAEQQHGLNAIGTSIAVAPKPGQTPAIANREVAKPELSKPIAAPPMMPAVAMPDKKPQPAVAVTTPPAQGIGHEAPKVQVPEKPIVGIPEHKLEQPVAHANPTAPAAPSAGTPKMDTPEHHMNTGQPAQPPKQAVITPVAPKPATPPPAAPKPTVTVSAPKPTVTVSAPKPAAPPPPPPPVPHH
jgi:hypothetical protein